MMRQTILLFALLLPTPGISAEAEMQVPPLTLTFATDEKLCAAAAESIAAEPPCRAFDEAACPRPDALKFRPVASDQYGYTEVALAPERPSAAYTILYLQRYRGDMTPRLMETWKVDRAELKKLFDTPPGLITFEDRFQFHPGPKSDLPFETNARELRDLLSASEKISNEWSATTELLGEPHAVVRECQGSWRFGGYYRCTRVSKLTFMKLTADRPATRSCEFAAIEKKPG
jgi:hypothetical protein